LVFNDEKQTASISTTLLAQMVLCALTVVSLLYLPIPILELLAQKYGVTSADMSISSFGFAYAIGFLIFGALSDRVGRKMVIACGLSALTLVTLLIIWAKSWEVFITLRILQGFCAATFPTVALVYLSERGTPNQRIWGMAWITTALLAAGIFGQVYALQIVVPFGLTPAFLGFAAIYATTALRFAFIKNEIPSLNNKSWLDTYRPILYLHQNLALRRTYLSAVLLLFSFIAFYLALDFYLGDILQEQGINKLQMRLFALPAFILALFASKIIAWLSSPHKAIILGFSVAASGLALAAISTNFGYQLVLVCSLIFVSGIALGMTSLNVRNASVSASEVRGIAVSTGAFMLFVGTSCAPFFVRALNSFSLTFVLSVLSCLLFAAVIYNLSYKDD